MYSATLTTTLTNINAMAAASLMKALDMNTPTTPKLPRYKYGYVSDEWGMGRSLGLIPDAAGNVCLYSDAMAAIASQPAPVLPESLHTFLDEAAGDGLVLNGIDAADLYTAIFPGRYAEAIAPILDALSAAPTPPAGQTTQSSVMAEAEALAEMKLPLHEPTIAISEILAEYLDEDDRDEAWGSIQDYADIHARAAVLANQSAPVAQAAQQDADWSDSYQPDGLRSDQIRARYSDAAQPSQPTDAEMLDWLDQNIFNRELCEWDGRLHPTKTMWVMFAPKGHQGSARNIIGAAIAASKGGAALQANEAT
jgi:hypothetical protein